MERTITDIYSTALVTQRDLDNWFARLTLNTEFAPTVSGRRRQYTKSNVLELAFIKAAVKAGMKASIAVSYAAAFVRGYGNASGMASRRWLAFPIGDPSSAIGTDTLDLAFVDRARAGQDGVTLIDLGAIISRVEAAFAEKEAIIERAGRAVDLV